MQKTDHYKEINFHAGHRVTGGRVYAYFVSTMERLRLLIAYNDSFCNPAFRQLSCMSLYTKANNKKERRNSGKTMNFCALLTSFDVNELKSDAHFNLQQP